MEEVPNQKYKIPLGKAEIVRKGWSRSSSPFSSIQIHTPTFLFAPRLFVFGDSPYFFRVFTKTSGPNFLPFSMQISLNFRTFFEWIYLAVQISAVGISGNGN